MVAIDATVNKFPFGITAHWSVASRMNMFPIGNIVAPHLAHRRDLITEVEPCTLERMGLVAITMFVVARLRGDLEDRPPH